MHGQAAAEAEKLATWLAPSGGGQCKHGDHEWYVLPYETDSAFADVRCTRKTRRGTCNARKFVLIPESERARATA